ncbi:hypothetical protein EVAR_82224_1 [Eumeta japonica]|uniref:Uncharacterized protein n=1 Tax=Eumeta variegata TaxID=151549 RepID=A0A4C1W7V8_EUMVA|nr:hypothetical protein EVAR_82224_1 [Eumeta japonica]
MVDILNDLPSAVYPISFDEGIFKKRMCSHLQDNAQMASLGLWVSKGDSLTVSGKGDFLSQRMRSRRLDCRDEVRHTLRLILRRG